MCVFSDLKLDNVVSGCTLFYNGIDWDNDVWFLCVLPEAHLASYLVGTQGPYLGIKCGQGVTTTHPI